MSSELSPQGKKNCQVNQSAVDGPPGALKRLSVPPAAIAAELRDAVERTGACDVDDVVVNYAVELMRDVGLILRAAEATALGAEYAGRTGCRLYTADHVAHFACHLASLKEPVAAIASQSMDERASHKIAPFMTAALVQAIRRQVEDWPRQAVMQGEVARLIKTALQLDGRHLASTEVH